MPSYPSQSEAVASPRLGCPVVTAVFSPGESDTLSKLLEVVPPALGVAFVVSSQLDPGRVNQLSELLTQHTHLSLVGATDGTVILADHVYLLPPNATMRIHDGVLQLTPWDPDGAADSPNDSLASTDAGVTEMGLAPHGVAMIPATERHTDEYRSLNQGLTVSDVTELRRGEAVLRQDKELMRLSAVLADVADAVILVEGDGRISAWNRMAEQMYGYSAAEAIGMAVAALIPVTDRATDLAVLAATLRGEPVEPWETQRVTRDGRVLDVSVRATPLRSEDGSPPAVNLTEHDLTPQKTLRRELEERIDRMMAILDAAADPVITIDESGGIESVNPATERVFGWPASELIGVGAGVLLAHGFQEYLTSGMRNASGVHREVLCLHRDGTTFPADLTVGRVEHHPLFVVILRAVTERKRLEREVLEIATSEQEHIGRELHDSIGQAMTGIRLMAETLVAGLRDRRSPELPLAERVNDSLRDCLRQVQRLSRGLVAAEVDSAGLSLSLADLAAFVSESSVVSCGFVATGGTPGVLAAAATHLLRIAQEAVTNVLRHSGAARVGIELVVTTSSTELRVVDDGRGFASEPGRPHPGLGLRLMRYRAGLIGATLRIETGTGGTLVSCSVPQEAAHGQPTGDSRRQGDQHPDR